MTAAAPISAETPAMNRWESPWLWAGLLLLFYAVVRLLSGYDGLYGQDPYAYYNYALSIQDHWRTGAEIGPFVWPRIYPLLGALWLWGDPLPWMQFLSMCGSALMLAMVIQLWRAAHPGARWIAPIAMVTVGLAPFLLRQSLSVLSDAPALGLLTWALWQGDRYLRQGRVHHLLLAALLTGFAVWTRYPVALVMAVPVLGWAWQAWRSRHWGALLAMLPCMLVAAIPHFFILPHPPQEGVGHLFQNSNFVQWSPIHAFQRTFVQRDGVQSFSTPNLLASYGLFWNPRMLGFALVGVVGLVVALRQNLRAQWRDWAALSVSALFLAGVPFQNVRFHVPMLPFAGNILSGIWLDMGRRVAHWGKWVFVLWGLLLCLQAGLGLVMMRAVVAESRLERIMAAELSAMPAFPGRYYEFTLEAMLQARCPSLTTVSMFDDSIPAPQAGDRVIFSEEAFATQFAGMAPMRHWAAMQARFTLREIHRWDKGWRAYVLE